MWKERFTLSRFLAALFQPIRCKIKLKTNVTFLQEISSIFPQVLIGLAIPQLRVVTYVPVGFTTLICKFLYRPENWRQKFSNSCYKALQTSDTTNELFQTN